MDINIKAKTIKFLVENIKNAFTTSGQDFSGRTQTALIIREKN